MRFRIQALNGELEDQIVEVSREALVGRAEECDVHISDRRLSRRHARFFVHDGRLFIEDLGSPNGTFVNDQRIERSELSGGDVVAVGKTRFRVKEAEGVASRTRPEIHRADLVKPISSTLLPNLEAMLAEDYFTAIGLGDQTLLDAGADKVELLSKKTRNFAILYEVSRAMQEAHDPEHLLARILDLILKVSHADRGYVALLDDTGEARITTMRTGSMSSARPEISQTVADHVLQKRCGVICSDPRSDERFREAESLFMSETTALMAAPILVNRRLLGLIEVESSHRAEKFTEDELDLLSVVCSTLGVALDNLRLAKKREETIRDLEEARERLLTTQNQLIKTEQLAAVGRLATGIAHEVKNHLSPFMLAEMIASRHPDDEEIRESADIMREAQQHILDLVNEVRTFAGGTRVETELKVSELVDLARGVLRFVRCDPAVRRTTIELAIEARPSARVDPRRLRQVLVNLIKNAAEASPDGGGEVRVAIREQADRAIIEVRDNGPGIPKENAPRIFEPFFTTKGEAGLGLGLDISRRIVREHGGELRFESDDRGTSFFLELPLPH
jgi:signal transduction histidine kinase